MESNKQVQCNTKGIQFNTFKWFWNGMVLERAEFNIYFHLKRNRAMCSITHRQDSILERYAAICLQQSLNHMTESTSSAQWQAMVCNLPSGYSSRRNLLCLALRNSMQQLKEISHWVSYYFQFYFLFVTCHFTCMNIVKFQN